MRTTFPRRPSSASPTPARLWATTLVLPLVAAGTLFAVSCGGGSDQSNPPVPTVVITADSEILDVGERFALDGSESTDPNDKNGTADDLNFTWRIIDGGLDTEFDDYCRDDETTVCSTNDDDHCSNDTERLCSEGCLKLGTCVLNSGTTSSECATGICGLGEGTTKVTATFKANVAGPYEVRLTGKGSQSNGTGSIILNTYPSLYVVGSLVQFGGTKGGKVGAVADAAEFAGTASEGVANPADGNLIIINDGDSPGRGLVREFDLITGKVVGTFGETGDVVHNPAALAFAPSACSDDSSTLCTRDSDCEDSATCEFGDLYVAQSDGDVLVFDSGTGLFLSTFGNVGADPVSMRFSPVDGHLLVASGKPGIAAFDAEGNDLGVLGDTGTATSKAVDLDILAIDSERFLLIADLDGDVVRCNADGENCGSFFSSGSGLRGASNPLAGSPTAIAVNPSIGLEGVTADVLIADPKGDRVLSCNSAGESCTRFGDTDEIVSEYLDLFFAPAVTPSTTTSSSTSTTLADE